MTRRKSVKVWTWRRMLRDHGPSRPGLLLTLHTIGTWMDADGYCYPSQKEIGKGARITDRTVKRHVKQAVKLGWLHTEPGPKGGKGWRLTAYFATVPEAVELSDMDEELTDSLHSQCGDVGEEYSQGEDTIMSPRSGEGEDNIVSPRSANGEDTIASPRSGNVSPKVGTSDAKVGTSVTQGGDTGDHKVGTQLCPTNSSVNSPEELSNTEGRAGARPLDSMVSHERQSEEHEQPTVADQPSQVEHEGNGASPTTISESRRQRILELAQHGYGLNAIALMSAMQTTDVEAVIREAAA